MTDRPGDPTAYKSLKHFAHLVTVALAFLAAGDDLTESPAMGEEIVFAFGLGRRVGVVV